MTLLTGQRWRPWLNFYVKGERFPSIEAAHLRGSCSYTIHAMDPTLSALPPWKPTVNAGDPSIYGVISPDGISPTQSTGTSQDFGNPSSPTQDHSATQSPTFNILFPGAAHTSRSSLDGSLSEESRAYSSPGNSGGDHSSFGWFHPLLPNID